MLAATLIIMRQHGVVLKELVGINAQVPCRLVNVKARHPTAQVVARSILKVAISSIRTTQEERICESFEALLVLICLLHPVLIGVRCASELRRHLQSQLQRYILRTNLHVARLAVVERALRIAVPRGHEVLLPFVVGSFAEGYMTLQRQPVVQSGDGPVFRQSYAHLRHRTGVDAQRLRTRTQLLILQLHGLLLGADGEHTLQPAPLHVSLLHYQRTRKSRSHSHVYAIA